MAKLASIITVFIMILSLFSFTSYVQRDICSKLTFIEGNSIGSFDYFNASVRETLNALQIEPSYCDVTFNRGFLSQISAQKGRYLIDLQMDIYEDVNDSTINKTVLDYLNCKVGFVRILNLESEKRIVNICTDTLFFDQKR